MIIATLLALAALQSPAITGSVFLDRNGNGMRDPGEPGIAKVVVSDQEHVTQTDARGNFSLDPGGFGLVFVSVPSGYRAVGPFYRSSAESKLDFALRTAPSPRSFSFIHASDTHLDSASLDRTRHLEQVVDSLKPDFVLITGDLVRDALRVPEAVATERYDLFAAEKKRFTRPVWTAPGNHEIFGIETEKSHVSPQHPLFGRGMYRHYFGPDYYSFNYGGVHFVGLNSEDIDDQWYYGHIDAGQLNWLELDLSFVPATTPVVTFNHIPFFTAAEMINGYVDEPPAPTLITVGGKTAFRHTVSNAGDALAILRKHRFPLALGGHIHIRETLEYALGGQNTRFEQAGAVVGPSEGAGLEFQSGVTLYRVTDGVISKGQFVAFPEPPEEPSTQSAFRWVDASPHRADFIQVGKGVKLELLDWGGKGPAMLFLSGLDDTGHEFDDFAPEWTDRFHVYALTRRGFGASSQPPGGYQIDSLTNDIRVVLDSLKIDRVVLVGHSIAGDELTRFATTWPERVSKLVYLDAAHDRVPLAEMFKATPPPPAPPMSKADSLSPATYREYSIRNYGVRYTMGEVLSIAVFAPDGRYLKDVTPPRVDAAILAGLAHPRYQMIKAPALAFYAIPESVNGMFSYYESLDRAGRAQADEFHRVFSPWVASERDRFKREVPNNKVVEIRGAHHYIFMSNEAEVIAAMRSFLAEH